MAQVTVGSQTYPSFISLADADLYLGGDILRAVPWLAASPTDRSRALASATRLLSALLIDPEAAAAAPPIVLVEVTAMLAADLLAKPKLFADASGDSNIKSVKAGSAQVEFFAPVEGGPAIPLNYWRLLSRAGLVAGDADISNAGAYVTGISGGRRPFCGRPAWDYPIAAEDYN